MTRHTLHGPCRVISNKPPPEKRIQIYEDRQREMRSFFHTPGYAERRGKSEDKSVTTMFIVDR